MLSKTSNVFIGEAGSATTSPGGVLNLTSISHQQAAAAAAAASIGAGADLDSDFGADYAESNYSEVVAGEGASCPRVS